MSLVLKVGLALRLLLEQILIQKEVQEGGRLFQRLFLHKTGTLGQVVALLLKPLLVLGQPTKTKDKR